MKTYEFKTDKIHFVLSRGNDITVMVFYKMDEELRGAGEFFTYAGFNIVSQLHPELVNDIIYFPGSNEDRDNERKTIDESDNIFQARLACIKMFMKQHYNWGKVTRVIPWL